jgi:hypothetical protein
VTQRARRRLVTASAIAVVVATAFLSGSGVGSSVAATRDKHGIPAGLAAAIHARLGPGAIRPGWAARVAEGPALGFSVALSADGTTALVGVPDAGPISTVFRASNWRNGEALVFHVSSAGSWSSTGTPVATLRPNSRAPFGTGWRVALSADGTTAFVGANSGGLDGVVYVFRVSSEDAWASSSAPTATLTVPGSVGLGSCALGVSSDGTTLVACDPYYQLHAPTAFVFHVSSESAWTTTSTPTAALTPPADGGLGRAVAISGDGTTVLLSDSGAAAVGGRAYVYHVASESSWASMSTPTAALSDANSGTGDASDALGYSLALSDDGTVAFLGGWPYPPKIPYVDVFHVAAADAWASTSTPTATLTVTGEASRDDFGQALAASTDGATALVSAPGLHSGRGGAYVFHVSGEGAWADSSAPTATLTHSGAHVGDAAGDAAALSGDGATVLLGVPEFNWQTGEADVFHAADASSWVTSSTTTAILTSSALPKPACVVPRLVGRALYLAKDTLDQTNCRLGKVTKVRSTKKNRRRVLWQSRAPKLRLPAGSKINLKIGK